MITEHGRPRMADADRQRLAGTVSHVGVGGRLEGRPREDASRVQSPG